MSFSNADTGSKTADPYTAKNADEPSLKVKVDDFAKFAKDNKFCLLTTKTTEGLLATRCMALADTETGGIDFIFHSNSESGKTDDLEANPQVNLGFLASSGEWASVSGNATIVTDRDQVKKYYSPQLKAWVGDLGDGKHDGGPEDPRIVLIRVKSKTIQYAISDKNAASSTLEVVKGAITGSTAKVNKLRKIEESDINQWRTVAA